MTVTPMIGYHHIGRPERLHDTHRNRFLTYGENLHSREEIGQRGLKRQGNRKTPNSERGNKRCDGYPGGVQYDKKGYQDYQGPDGRLDDTGRALYILGPPRVLL